MRADARRNRELLMAAALEAFTERGADDTSLEEIARRAGVGIGTLYRHFPGRTALLEAVYTDQVRAWLMTMYMLWNTEVGEFKSESTATIELFDVYQVNPVATWVLEGVYPLSWSGPQMSAKSNEVAMETLVLEHNGFLASLP